MSNAMDMSTPVTRGELRQELQLFRQELKQEVTIKQDLEEAFATLATKQELEEAFATLATKQELEEAFATLATKQELATKLDEAVATLATKQDLEVWGGALLARMDQKFEQMEKRSLAQLASHVKAIEDSLGKTIAVVDEKYNDLPRRVKRLETAVLPGKRR